MKKTLIFLTLAIPSFALPFNCDYTAGGTAGDWNDAANWNNCNGTYPHNTGGNTYTANGISEAVVIPSGESYTIGHSYENWAVTFNSTTDKVTCVSASCPFVNGDIVEYTRQYTVTASTNYPTGVPAMAKLCLDNSSGSPASFDIKLDNCGAAVLNFTGNGSGTFYMRIFQPAIAVAAAGSVQIQSGGAMRLQGDMRIAPPSADRCSFEILGGGTLTYDSSASTAPTITGYGFFQPSAAFVNKARFCMTGSAGNMAVLTSDTTGGAIGGAKYLNGTYDSTYNGDMILDYADVSCMGTSSGTAANQRYFWNHLVTGDIVITNSLFHTCSGGTTVGAIYWSNGSNGAATNRYVFEDSRWLDGVDNCSGWVVNTANNPTGAGVRSFKRSIHTCRFGDANAPSMAGGEFQYNVFVNLAPNMGATATWSNFYYNIAINDDTGADAGFRLNAAGGGVVNVHHNMFYATAGGNVRGFKPSDTNDNQVYEYFYQAIAQGSGVSTVDGDMWQSRGTGTSVTARNVVIPPNWQATVGPRSPGSIGTGGSAVTPWTIQNWTTYNCPARVAQGVVTPCAVTLAEAGAGATGIVANYKGFLIYGEATFTPTTPNAMHFTGSNTSVVTNTATASGVQFNGCYIAGSSCGASSVYFATNGAAAPLWTGGAAGVTLDNFGTHYDVPMTGGTVPGANDMNDVNPGYMGMHKRTMETYVVSRGGTGTAAGVKSYWSGLAATTLVNELTGAFNYLFYGWTPFNIRYSMPSSGANGKYLGAVRPALFFGTF